MTLPPRGGAGLLASLELLVIAGAVALSLLDARFLPLAVLAALCFWLLRALARVPSGLPMPLNWAVFGLLIMSLVAVLVSAFPALTLPQVYRLLSGVALFYALVRWAGSPLRLRWLVAVLVLISLGLALFAAVSVEWFVDKLPFIPPWLYARFRLLVADTINPNVMAGTLLVFWPLALAILLFGWRQLHSMERLLFSLAALAMTVVLVLTQSRGAWVVAGLVLLLMIVSRWRWGWLGAAALALGGAAAALLISSAALMDLVNRAYLIESFEKRVELWSRAVLIIQDFPITGIGMGSFGAAGDLLYPFIHSLPEAATHAHNLFLQIAVDLGLPGLLAWIVLFLWVVVCSWRIFTAGRATGNTWQAGLGAGLLCSQAALALYGLVDAVTWGMTRTPPFVWLLWGVAVAGASLLVKPPSDH